MLSEDFDKKIREAAQHHHPSYDERAWAGMKKQLDKHMPEKDDRRRRGLFFLLLFLLLGGGAALYLWGPFGNKEKSAPDAFMANRQPSAITESGPEKKQSASTVSTSNEPAILSEAPSATIRENKVDNEPAISEPEFNQPVADRQLDPVAKKQVPGKDNPVFVTKAATRGSKQKIKPVSTPQQSKQQPSDQVTGTDIKKNPDVNPLINLPAPPLAETRPVTTAAENKSATTSAPVPAKAISSKPPNPESDTKTLDPVKPTAVAKESQPKNEKEAKTKILARKKSNFFFAVSAGPDVSFTSGDDLGRMKMVGGFGLGYTFRGRITLRTGLYTGKKVYTASPANYKGSPQFYQYYPNLQKIDADCQVQEIPLNLSYHFGNKNNRPIFVSAGVSSLIMKEETYNYFYKYNASGPVISRSHSTYNLNRHFFSQLNISAGYQLPLGKRFSVIAEPYLKLPMGGVGNGKVRLNSTGIMFTITANPFGKLSSVKSK